MQDFIEAEQKEFEEELKTQALQLSECVDVMPENVDKLKKRAYNIMLDLGYSSNRLLRAHDQRLIAKIVEMVEGKKVKVIYCVDRLECEDEHCLSCDSGMSNCDFAEQNKSYNQAINDILTSLKGK